MKITRQLMIAFASIVCLLQATQPIAKADIISDFKQQNATVESTASSRAIYLGRLFNNVEGGAFRRMEAMYAIVTIAQANNVSLFAGNAASGFEAALAANQIFDTGLRVNTVSQNATEVVFVPGDPDQVAPQAIPIPAGLAIHDSLALNRRLDFWLVGAPGSGFTVPSTIGGNPASFFIEFHRTTSVPEPTTLALLCVPATGALLAARRKKKLAKKAEPSVGDLSA
jgi:hypothetical protein